MLEQLKLKYYYLPKSVKTVIRLGSWILIGFSCAYAVAKHDYEKPAFQELSPSMQQWQEEYAKEMVKKEICEMNYGREYCKYR